MSKTKQRNSIKLQCKNCGRLRQMSSLVAIDPEIKNDDGKPIAFPVSIRKTLELVKSDVFFKLPKYYCGTCSVCSYKTFFEGKNRGKALFVLDEY